MGVPHQDFSEMIDQIMPKLVKYLPSDSKKTTLLCLSSKLFHQIDFPFSEVFFLYASKPSSYFCAWLTQMFVQ